MEILTVPAGSVHVDLLDGDRICHHHRNGGFETESLAAWADLCRDGGTVYDVGAYTGIYSIAAAKLGCSVSAFEPLPKNVMRLKDNARINDVAIVLHQCAVADFSGTADLHYNPYVAFTSGASFVAGGNAVLPVDVIRLDDLPVETVFAIKIDTERNEDKVLLGAAGIIKAHKPRFLIEALDELARARIKRLLPAYREAAFLDGRNMLMVPA